MNKIKVLLRILQAYLKPDQYIRNIGVKCNGKVTMYCNPYKVFGSEPWLITLGDNVYITSGVRFITHDGGTLILRKEIPDLEITKPIKVGDDVYFGLNCMVMPGIKIGNRCIIAAGSVVTKDIPDNSVVAGVPAKIIKSTDAYLQKIEKESLHLGNLSSVEKARELKKIYHVNE